MDDTIDGSPDVGNSTVDTSGTGSSFLAGALNFLNQAAPLATTVGNLVTKKPATTPAPTSAIPGVSSNTLTYVIIAVIGIGLIFVFKAFLGGRNAD